jgi:glutaminyl-peptide cyclotransferase
MNKIVITLAAICLMTSCTDTNKDNNAETTTTPPLAESFVPTIYYTIVARLPHDTTSFTEGLLFHDQQLFESTGSPENIPETKSVLGIVNLSTGKIDVKAELDRSIYFGEGIVFFKNKIYQLTYKNQIGFIYDSKTFKQIGRFTYQNKEGWSLTTDGTNIIMSDGTNRLTYLDPENMKVVKTLDVTNNGYAEDLLNELEYINGFIYANIWTKNYIVKINPKDGKIVGLLDLSALSAEAKDKNPEVDVINGIAFDAASNKIYVTGKLWANIYQIEFPH